MAGSFFAHLRERKLVQWALAYLAGAWFALEILGFLATTFYWPDVIVRSATVLMGVGLLITLVLAWYHGEKGRQRVSGPELLLVAGLLVVAGAAIAWVRGGEVAELSPTIEGGPTVHVAPNSIAVLPFEDRSATDEDALFFAEGLHEETLTLPLRSAACG